MASLPEENLRCPICHDIFKDPVLLSCSHTFCKACWQRWWKEKAAHQCPVCKTTCFLYDPPRNLVAKNLGDVFSVGRDRSWFEALCSLHLEDLKLFCLEHQQPVCVICLHSSSHTNHSFRPIDEAALDYKEGLRVVLKPLQEKLELFKDIKENFDQTAKDIEVQAQDTERQIKDEFLTLQRFLQKEQQARLVAVREEKKQKSQMMKWKIDALSREIAALSDTVKSTEEVLRAQDLSFMQNYKAAAEKVDGFQLNDPQPIPGGGLMDTAKHLNNLPFVVLDSIKKRIPTSDFSSKTNSETMQYCPTNPERSAERSAARYTRPLSVAAAVRSETRGLNLTGYKPQSTTLTSLYDDDHLYG